MNITTYANNSQAYGEFDGGKIMENKPIGFPQDGGKQKPYSNLFYWAHAYTNAGGTIALHPHQGFEIISFILKGEISHYDTAHKEWLGLSTGDIQIIRAGKGISHAEKMLPGSEIFQIWFDPDLSKTLGKDASYNDYRSASFPVTTDKGISTKTYKGAGSPLVMDTQGLAVKELSLDIGEYTFDGDEETIYSMYLIEGSLSVSGTNMEKDSFSIVREAREFKLSVSKRSKLFIIENPVDVGYKTYSERNF